MWTNGERDGGSLQLSVQVLKASVLHREAKLYQVLDPRVLSPFHCLAVEENLLEGRDRHISVHIRAFSEFFLCVVHSREEYSDPLQRRDWTGRLAGRSQVAGEVSAGSLRIQADGNQTAHRRAADGASGDGKDAAGARDRWRGVGAVLFRFGIGV